MKSDFRDGVMTIFLEGRIDSSNAAEMEKDVLFTISMLVNTDVAFDVDQLEYISSAGLRVLMKARKRCPNPPVIVNASDEIFDILDTTGFTEMFKVRRKLRHLSLEGCTKISSSTNGEYFALTDDEMVKVYGKDVPLSVVYQERDMARQSMLSGIPTLIPYDVVVCGDRYGIVYEKSDAGSFKDILAKDSEHSELYGKKLAESLRELHEINVAEDGFPNIKERYDEWLEEAGGLLQGTERKELSTLINSLPDRDTWVSGNLNLSSILLHDDEVMYMDMAGSAYGHPIFDIQGLFAELMANPRVDPEYTMRTYGIPAQVCNDFWRSYYDTYMTDTSKEMMVSMYKLMTKSFVLKQKLIAALEKKNGGAV